MDAIINMIFVEGDLILTFVHMFVFVFSLEFVLGFANLIKGMGKSVRS